MAPLHGESDNRDIVQTKRILEHVGNQESKNKNHVSIPLVYLIYLYSLVVEMRLIVSISAAEKQNCSLSFCSVVGATTHRIFSGSSHEASLISGHMYKGVLPLHLTMKLRLMSDVTSKTCQWKTYFTC